MDKYINKYMDVLLALLTIIALANLFLAQSLLTYFIAAEFVSLVLVFTFAFSNTSVTTSTINSIFTILFWPRSRNWLWICAILLNVIVIYEMF
jgi:hypothetical protein